MAAEGQGCVAEFVSDGIDGHGEISAVARLGSAVIDFAEQVGLDAALVVEVAHADAGQAHVHAFLPDVIEQLERYGHKDILVVGGVGKPALRRASAAVRVFELERHGTARQSLTAQTATDRLTQQRDRRFDIPALG